MEVKKGKELQTELKYQEIQKQREEYAGEDCLTVVDGNHVVPIGRNYGCQSCCDFIIRQLVNNPEKFMVKGYFTDTEDMYGYLFESCNDESELRSFLEDYYDGMEMENYGKRY